MKIIVFEPDLIFSSRIENAARRIGLDCRIVTDIEDLSKTGKQEAAKGLLINLDAFGSTFEVLDEFRERKCLLFGYYSHLSVELGETAKRAGVNAISRRAFFSGLDGTLRSIRG